MKTSILLLVALFAMFAYARAACPPGNQLCGAQCFNPATHHCIQPGNHLCPVGTDACGAACFNPALYHCVNGGLVQGPAPVPTASESIVTGGGNCGSQATCGAQCYNPSTHSCQNGNQVCPLGGYEACGTACFLPSQYHCVNGVLVQGPAPAVTVSESIVTAVSPSLTPNPCGTGQALCGTQCFVTSLYKCITGNHLCNCGAPNFCPGDGACYSTASFSCCGTTTANSHLVSGANKCAAGQNKGISTGVGCA